jgi:hypothetical protein
MLRPVVLSKEDSKVVVLVVNAAVLVSGDGEGDENGQVRVF